jgi:hypothetical protein
MGRIFPIILIVIAAFSCSSGDTSMKKAELVKQMIDAFNRHDWEKMAGYYTEKADFLDPSFGTEYGPKSRKETVEK